MNAEVKLSHDQAAPHHGAFYSNSFIYLYSLNQANIVVFLHFSLNVRQNLIKIVFINLDFTKHSCTNYIFLSTRKSYSISNIYFLSSYASHFIHFFFFFFYICLENILILSWFFDVNNKWQNKQNKIAAQWIFHFHSEPFQFTYTPEILC